MVEVELKDDVKWLEVESMLLDELEDLIQVVLTLDHYRDILVDISLECLGVGVLDFMKESFQVLVLPRKLNLLVQVDLFVVARLKWLDWQARDRDGHAEWPDVGENGGEQRTHLVLGVRIANELSDLLPFQEG